MQTENEDEHEQEHAHRRSHNFICMHLVYVHV